MKIVILDKMTLGDDIDLSGFDQFGEVVMYESTTKAQTSERIGQAQIVVTNKVVIDQEVMDTCDIKLICVAATGMNNIDLAYAKAKGIEVKNVAGYSTPSVVQTTFALALYLIGKMRYYDDYTKGDGWVNSPVFTNLTAPYTDIAGKTWGIIGLGAIGKEVAKVAAAFGAKVQYYSTSGQNSDATYERVDLNRLLESSDILSIHAPLNDQTLGLINADNLPKLKKNAVLLNLGRGGIIDEAALAAYIDVSEISVGLDVLSKEPMEAQHPLRNIQRKEALCITPHIAWASVESRIKLVEGICNNIATFLGGK